MRDVLDSLPTIVILVHTLTQTKGDNMTDQTDKLIEEVQSNNKAIEHENVKKQNHKLKRLLADMCMHADEDTPSEHRTRHFNDTMTTSYDYLHEIGHLKEPNKKKEEQC
tara:strand:+ start:196 stop:522 length:327 start_codon:yes stop_codon:yes gene_type:complete